MTASVTLKIGPIKAKFKGNVELSNRVPPESYTISGEGTGGAAGFAKGGADVKLIEEGEATLLQYAVNADVGGKIAQLGARLIDSTATKLSAAFFAKFCDIVEAQETSAMADGDLMAGAVDQPVRATGVKPWVWVMIGTVLVISLFALAG